MKKTTLLLLIIIKINCDELYENSTNICKKCICTKSLNYQLLTLNCTLKNYQHTISNWPLHNKTIISIFNYNNITTLETLPPTNATLNVHYSHCLIKYLNPGLFEACKNVELVDFSHNLITSEELSSEKFKGPYNKTKYEPINIKYLNLAYNKIHTLNKNLFQHMPLLILLNIEGNNLKYFDLHTQLALSSINKLQNLNMANNQLTELIDNFFLNKTNLIELNLSDNNFDFIPTSLKLIGNTMEKLIINNNPIIELNYESFLNFNKLIELSINNLSELNHINGNTFVPLINLKKLSITNNLLLKSIDVEAFGLNTTIDELYLNNNCLNHLNSKLLKWENLKIFKFNNNPFDCSCDLYNITNQLNNNIKMNKNDWPYCYQSNTGKSLPIYSLNSDICTINTYSLLNDRYVRHHFTYLRLTLVTLSIVLLVSIFVAGTLGYTKLKRFQHNRHTTFASQVLYNPLTTQARF